MIFTYNFEQACKLIELFTQNQIITLKIYLDTSLGEENAKYVFDYKTYEDYPAEEHINIRSKFNEKNLQIITQAVSKLNEFVSMMEINNVNTFKLSFDILNKELVCSKSYKKPLKDISAPNVNESYNEFINDFEKFLTLNGIHKMNVPGLFEKTSGNNTGTNNRQRNGVKYAPITFGQLVYKLKDVIIDNGDN